MKKKEAESNVEDKTVIVEALKEEKPKVKIVVITAKKGKLRFMPTIVSRVLTSFPMNTELKFYRKIKGKAVLGSDVWYHTDKGYIHSSQAVIVER